MKALQSFFRLIKSLFVPDRSVGSVLHEEALQTPAKTIFKNFLRQKLGILGVLGFISMLAFSFIGSSIKPIDLSYVETTLRNIRPGLNYLRYPGALERDGVSNISSGVSFSIGLSEKGDVYLWGKEPAYILDGLSTSVLKVPDAVKAADIVKVVAGDRHVLALDSTGRLHGWGFNNFQQTEAPAALVAKLNSKPAKSLIADEAYSAVLFEDGELYVWGSVMNNRLDSIPTAIQGRIVKVASSAHNMALLLDDGTVAVTGIRGNPFSEVPQHLQDGSTKVVDLIASYRAVLALDDRGQLHMWGDVQHDVLTIPSFTGNVVAMDSGKNNMMLLLDTGEVVYWGGDHFNQLAMPSSMSNAKVVEIYTEMFQSYAVSDTGKLFAWGSKGFVFGTDEFGRDVLTRLIHGGRISLTVGAIAVVISITIALFVGMTSGFFGGWVDMILMRFTDIVTSIPFLPIAITLSAVLGGRVSQTQRIYLIMVIIGVLSWTGLARLVRAQILLEREKDFVLAAKALGVRQKNIIVRHILPNVFNLVIVSITLSYAGSLLTEAGLSFLGFGVSTPTPSWGNMLQGAQTSAVLQYYWWRWLIPGAFVVLTALCANLIGDALREAMDPKANEK
ncbi:MAG TPA: ABC transporter permease subunit [Bacillota bacterium]|nr:ABC transporter permease subunit [Bacillota bacterium]